MPVREMTGLLSLAGLALATCLISLPIFTPMPLATYFPSVPILASLSLAPLAWVVWVPWAVGVCQSERGGRAYVISYLLGAVWFLTHMRWMYATTGPGYIAGSLYLGTHFVLMAWPLRYLVRVRRWSLTWALPVCVVGMEMFRSLGPLGFPWFLMGHTQIMLSPLIQIADVTGAYGVSFVVVMLNGWLAHQIVSRIGAEAASPLPASFYRRHVHTIIAVMVILATLGYGLFRLNQRTIAPGPTVAVIQGDYLLSTSNDPDAPNYLEKRRFYFQQMQQAAQDQPDLIVLPETPWEAQFLNPDLHALLEDDRWRESISPERWNKEYRWMAEYGAQLSERLRRFTREAQTHLVIGSLSVLPQADGEYPDELKYNSAYLYHPDGRAVGRYDKVHLVIFGEYVPFRYALTLDWLNRLLNIVTPWRDEGFELSIDLHWLYQLLNRATPWGAGGYEYSLEHGTAYRTFALSTNAAAAPGEALSTSPADGGDTRPAAATPAASVAPQGARFGVTICYEDVMPSVFRSFILDEQGRKRVDFMLNISNDGWFGRDSQQVQHLVSCAFRAVENRVGVARAVNTGVSGFIDPTGRWRDLIPEAEGPPRAGGQGHRIARVMTDSRVTAYSRVGDVFGFACLVIWAVATTLAIWHGRGQRRARRAKREVV